MPGLPFHQHQLDFMVELTRNRIEWLDPVFRFLNYFDSPYFFFVLIPVIWLGYSYQWGLRIFYWFTLNSVLCSLAKRTIGWPRPSTDLPELGMFHPQSNGFPSGGAQICMFLGAILIYYWRTPAAWVIGSVYILLISFSRLYLGVHYPLDVLGGWALALILFFLFIITKDPIDRFLAKKSHFFGLILSLVIPAIVMLLIPRPGTYYMMGSCMGVGVGTYFSLKHHLFLPKPKNIREGLGRSFIGICILYIIVLLLPGKGSFAQSFIAGLFMSLLASPICKWFYTPR